MACSREEACTLSHICLNAPVAPGDVLSKAAVASLEEHGWVKKDEAGSFVPTALGRSRNASLF